MIRSILTQFYIMDPKNQQTTLDQPQYKIDESALGYEDRITLYKIRDCCNNNINNQKEAHEFLSADISWFRIGEIGAMFISNCSWVNLRHLHLNGSKIGNKGCKIISKNQWKHLEILQLYQNQISQSGAMHLSKNKWRKLNLFHIGINSITIDGLRAIGKSDWDSLQLTYVYKNVLSFQMHGFFCICVWDQLKQIHDIDSQKGKKQIQTRFPMALLV